MFSVLFRSRNVNQNISGKTTAGNDSKSTIIGMLALKNCSNVMSLAFMTLLFMSLPFLTVSLPAVHQL